MTAFINGTIVIQKALRLNLTRSLIGCSGTTVCVQNGDMPSWRIYALPMSKGVHLITPSPEFYGKSNSYLSKFKGILECHLALV